MTQNSEVSMPIPATANQTTCSNCHSKMPADLRFCRNCGFRLADGMGGFTGTQVAGTDPSLARGTSAVPAKRKRRMSGMSWIFVGLLVFFIGAAAFTALVSPVRQGVNVARRAPVIRSYIGIDEVNRTDQGLMINAVSVPGGPADKAGLIGGDLILAVNGQPVQTEEQFEELMQKTQPGQPIDIQYLRDTETKTAKLTTITTEEHRRMSREFERRPEGRAQFGYDDSDAERVLVPGTNIYGVKLESLLRSRPADLAGIKENDI